MDVSVYFSAVVAGAPLAFVVFGLVWWYGQLAPGFFSGARQFASSMLTGLVLGVMYFVSTTRPPEGASAWQVYVYWFGAGIYGLGLGVLASAGYDQAKAIVRGAVDRYASGLRAGIRQQAEHNDMDERG